MIMSTPKSFRMRTSKKPRKCSFQRIYENANSFRIRTYKKQGVGGNLVPAAGHRPAPTLSGS